MDVPTDSGDDREIEDVGVATKYGGDIYLRLHSYLRVHTHANKWEQINRNLMHIVVIDFQFPQKFIFLRLSLCSSHCKQGCVTPMRSEVKASGCSIFVKRLRVDYGLSCLSDRRVADPKPAHHPRAILSPSRILRATGDTLYFRHREPSRDPDVSNDDWVTNLKQSGWSS